MRTSRYLATVAVAALVSVLVPLSPANADPGAAATNVLTHTSPAPNGPAVAIGDNLASGLKTGTTARFTSSSGGSTGITCTTSNFVGTVTGNPATPGIATGTVGTHTFSGCTENITGVNSVQSITVNNLPFNVSFNSSTKVISITAGTAIQTTVVLNTILGQITCVYRAANSNTITGTASNAGNSMSFVNQQFTKSSGPFTCFNNAFWTATYAPVRDISVAGSPLVYVN